MKEKPTLIELKNVAKYYEMGENLVKALDGVDITIEEGDFVAIMGPSGSGKSTGMNLTGSLDLATKGDIYLDGENIELLGESELAQIRGKKIGFIFQQFNLIPNLTAKENVMLPMWFMGKSEEEAHCSVRFSLSHQTTDKDIVDTLKAFKTVLHEMETTVRFLPCK